MEKENKEMDLFDLLEKLASICKKCFSSIGDGILWIIRFKIKNWLILTLFSVIGIAVAYYYYMPENRKKYVEFRVQINGTNSYALNDIVLSLNHNLNLETENADFAKLLKLDQRLVAPIKRIEPFYVIDLTKNGTPDYVDYKGTFEEDSLNTKMRNFLNIRMTVKGNSDYNAIQNAIISYLRNIPYLKNEELERIKVLQNDIVALDKEIAKLDSMSKLELTASKLDVTMDKTSLVFNKPNYHSEIIRLKKEKSNIQEMLDLQKEVVTVYSNVIIKAKRSDVFILLTRFIPVYFIGFMLALLISYRKKIRKLLKD